MRAQRLQGNEVPPKSEGRSCHVQFRRWSQAAPAQTLQHAPQVRNLMLFNTSPADHVRTWIVNHGARSLAQFLQLEAQQWRAPLTFTAESRGLQLEAWVDPENKWEPHDKATHSIISGQAGLTSLNCCEETRCYWLSPAVNGERAAADRECKLLRIHDARPKERQVPAAHPLVRRHGRGGHGVL